MRYKAFLLVFLLLLTSCVPKTETESKEETTQEPKTESVSSNTESAESISITMRPASTFNPLLNEDAYVDRVLGLIFLPLLRIDDTFSIVPSVADSYEYSEDGETITLRIKDLSWHDGNVVTASDVKYSVDTLINDTPLNGVYKSCAENISNCKIIDSETVSITFNESSRNNIYSLSFPVISKNYYESAEALKDPMGDGLYKFKSYTPPKELCLERAGERQENHVNDIKVIISPDEETDLYLFNKGSIDCVDSEKGIFQEYNDKDAESFCYISSTYDFIGLNFNRYIFKDLNIRKAIAMSINKTGIIKNIYLEDIFHVTAPIFPSSKLYNNTLGDYEYNTKEAERFLSLSGWEDKDGDGLREKSINEYSEKLMVSVLVNKENEARIQIAKSLVESLNSIGFKAEITEVDFDEYMKRISEKSFDIFIGGFKFSYDNDLSEILATNGSMNYVSYSDSRMDSLLANAQNTYGEAQENAFYSLQEHIINELPYISIGFVKKRLFVSGRIKEGVSPYECNVFNNIENWILSN
ncbi:MAG: ABC transporter substrate-binding protein [Lachnospiraceae bacterium]|nr:ABC transporter substrate-binding protein [Lachnospiraceae bacterium]